MRSVNKYVTVLLYVPGITNFGIESLHDVQAGSCKPAGMCR
jgi:hypothetical protein